MLKSCWKSEENMIKIKESYNLLRIFTILRNGFELFSINETTPQSRHSHIHGSRGHGAIDIQLPRKNLCQKRRSSHFPNQVFQAE